MCRQYRQYRLHKEKLLCTIWPFFFLFAFNIFTNFLPFIFKFLLLVLFHSLVFVYKPNVDLFILPFHPFSLEFHLINYRVRARFLVSKRNEGSNSKHPRQGIFFILYKFFILVRLVDDVSALFFLWQTKTNLIRLDWKGRTTDLLIYYYVYCVVVNFFPFLQFFCLNILFSMSFRLKLQHILFIFICTLILHDYTLILNARETTCFFPHPPFI